MKKITQLIHNLLITKLKNECFPSQYGLGLPILKSLKIKKLVKFKENPLFANYIDLTYNEFFVLVELDVLDNLESNENILNNSDENDEILKKFNTSLPKNIENKRTIYIFYVISFLSKDYNEINTKTLQLDKILFNEIEKGEIFENIVKKFNIYLNINNNNLMFTTDLIEDY